MDYTAKGMQLALVVILGPNHPTGLLHWHNCPSYGFIGLAKFPPEK